MSDRITIDHINNLININVNSFSFKDMSNEDILNWLKSFINNSLKYNLNNEISGDVIPSDNINQT